jgi:hypothetical protein
VRAQPPPPREQPEGGKPGPSTARIICLTLAGAAAVLIVLGAIGSGGDNDYVVTCSTAPAAVVDAVASGLTTAGPGSLTRGRIGRVSGSAGAYLVADIEAEGIEGSGPLAVWWVGGDLTGYDVGPIAAIDGIAREFSDWGAAAQPGSPADEARERREPEARAVKSRCG